MNNLDDENIKLSGKIKFSLLVINACTLSEDY